MYLAFSTVCVFEVVERYIVRVTSVYYCGYGYMYVDSRSRKGERKGKGKEKGRSQGGKEKEEGPGREIWEVK